MDPTDLPPELDNGAAGHDTHKHPEHVGPAAACPDTLHPSDGSLLVRVLPDGPRRPDGSLAFTAGLCVYLPPGYLRHDRRYPVVYLLHGGGGDAADAVTFGGVRQTMDGLIAADPDRAAIVVMPDGTDGHWYDSLDGSIRNETYVLDHVVPYVDARFRTVADRGGRAVVGVSNGGFGAMLFAARAPDRFAAAGGMSSNLHGEMLMGLGRKRGAYAQGHRAAQLAGNLRPVAVTMDIASSCPSRDPADRPDTLVVDRFFLAANRAFVRRLRQARRPGDAPLEYRETEGSHAWRWWAQWLRERQLPFVLDHLAAVRRGGVPVAGAPAPPWCAPPAFDYRSIAPAFSVWGYEVRVDRRKTAFTTLSDVRPDRVTVEATGAVTVTTPAWHRPGTAVPVTVSGDDGRSETAAVHADAGGRLTVRLELGSGSRRTVAVGSGAEGDPVPCSR